MSFQRSFLECRNWNRLGKIRNPGRKRLLSHSSFFSNSSDVLFVEDSRRQFAGLRLGGYWRPQPTLALVPSPRYFSTDKEKKNRDDHETTPRDDGQELFWAHWIHELQSPPNLITLSRILSTPMISYWIIVTGNHQLALGGCVLAAASDWLDGYLAKKHNMATVLGAYLDPLADKIFINVLSVSLWATQILPGPLVALWLSRDVLLVIGAARFVRSQSRDGLHAYDPTVTPLRVNPTNVSKANTALQFITVGLGIVYPLWDIPPEVLTGFCYLTGATTIASGFSYLDYSAFSDSGNKSEKDKDASSSKQEDKK